MSPSREFDILFHPRFKESLLRLRDSIKKTAVEKKLVKFKQDPIHYTIPYQGDLAGNRKIKVLTDLRIVVTLCWECRQTNHQSHHKCPCDEIEENTAICWFVGDHKGVGRRALRIVTSPWELKE